MDEADRRAIMRLVPLLRKGDRVAQAETCDLLFEPVFRSLLKWSRAMNSEFGGPLPDIEVQGLAMELAGDAFMSAFKRIDQYDGTRASLFTFVVWRGRALMNGVVKKEVVAALRRTSLEGREEADEESAGTEAASSDNVEEEVIARLTQGEVEAILAEMLPDQAQAILEVWIRPRPLRRETEIQAAARLMGRSHDAMDSLLRRALKRFRQLWIDRQE